MQELKAISFVSLASALWGADVPAFPGAEGFGKLAKGGRGGEVCHVTNLNDSGPGSFRHCIDTMTGPRTIVFDVGGTIILKRPLVIRNKAYLTIAGQTAPGKGITLRDQPLCIYDSHDVVVRFLRVRLGDENKKKGDAPDVMTVNGNHNIILDHLSLSWGIDGNSDYRGNSNMSLQWLIYSEALNNSLHPKGAHAMCTSIRDCKGNASVHHNIYATSRNRHPTLGSGTGRIASNVLLDFRNNLIYNWSGPTNLGGLKLNVVNNYYRPGPMTDITKPPLLMKDSNLDNAQGYMAGNVFEGMEAFTRDNYAAVRYTNTGNYASTTRERWAVRKEFPTAEFSIPTQTAQDAYEACLRYSGCSLVRDTVDERLINWIRARVGRVVDSQKEVGGWDTYPEVRRPRGWDTDGDGMPDEWERQHGLDPHNPADGTVVRDKTGYTNLEVYLNELASKAQPPHGSR
jgi:pectate lyase